MGTETRGGLTTNEPLVDQVTLDRFAELAVGFAANVQPGQLVGVASNPGKELLHRAIAGAAYRAQAQYVDVAIFDPAVRSERLRHAPAETLDYIPPYMIERVRQLGASKAAYINLWGQSAPPHMLAGIDPERAARDKLPSTPNFWETMTTGAVNWTVIPAPTQPWAELVYPASLMPPPEALKNLWQDIAHICHLDDEDPIALWRERQAFLSKTAKDLTERAFTALRFKGPGTDLQVGLLPTSRWVTAVSRTDDGIEYVRNWPSQEAWTAPDPMSVEGTVRATKAVVIAGKIIRGLRIRFEGGQAVAIHADEGQDFIRSYLHTEPARRLGEVALVDGKSRIGDLDKVFYDTLIDENSGSHVALGNAYDDTVGPDDKDRINKAGSIHADIIIGGPDVDVYGVTANSPDEVPVLINGRWKYA